MNDGLVVVTGATGFVGRAVCERLQAARRPLLGTVRKAVPGAPAYLQPVGDLAVADDDTLDDLLSGAAAVVHLAGRAHVMTRGGDDERAYREANVAATARLARAAVRCGVARFVLASTVKVNGETSPRAGALRPDDPPRPADAYARSKLEAERALLAAVADSATVPVILRLPLVYGRFAKGNFARLVKAVITRRTLPLASIDNRRSLLYVGNLVEAVMTVVDAEPAPAGVHFVADAEAVSTPDLVRAIAAAWKVPPRLVAMPMPLLRLAGVLAGRRAALDRLTGTLVVDTTSLRAATGWTPRYSLDAALIETARARASPRPASAGIDAPL
jgi:nucleoside-diphosphate-sugar epimerase